MAFNNREGTNSSMVVEFQAPTDSAGFYSYTSGSAFGPADTEWSYSASGFYSNHLGGNQRLANGNTMISESTSGNLFEVTSAGNIVWSFSPGGQIVRVLRYGFDYPGLVAVSNITTSIPENYDLSQNYPNPFNPVTTIKFELPKQEKVTMKVYDILGNEVRTLIDNESRNPGQHSVVWDGKFNSGLNAATGVYFYKLVSENFTKTMKMILAK